MEEVCEGKDFSFPGQEEKILSFWSEIKAFETQLARTESLPEYIFYDGPPFATGLPHYGHILAGTIKDIVTRYQTMRGHHVTRRFGWDCHGLPVENEIDRKLGIKRRDEVLKMGIDKYNDECRSIVTRYVEEWEKVISRTGRWIDFRNDYKTMDLKFMESVWWVFSQLYEKGLVYKGFKVMPYSTGCKTVLSNFEAGQNYKDVPDPEIMMAFPIIDDPHNASFVAWTTTPWTLPSNLALCVNGNFDYVKVRNKYTGRVYVVAESRLSALPVEKPKSSVANGPADLSDTAFRVVADNYVTDDSGTGIVHCAPAFGEDDYRVCIENQIINKGEILIVAVDDDGCFTERITDFSGRYVKDADKDIIENVKSHVSDVKKRWMVGNGKKGFIVVVAKWCSDASILIFIVTHVFVVSDGLSVEKRFHNWLENARDWAVSRSRFWGTPLPVWTSEDGEEVIVMDSVAKLEKLSGAKVFDLHRHNIDHITIPSSRGPEFGVLRRVDDVSYYILVFHISNFCAIPNFTIKESLAAYKNRLFYLFLMVDFGHGDCEYLIVVESGSMPYAYIHYPFENVELFEKNFPGQFIAEGLDQTRGWFYTLMVLSTALFGKPAFRNLVCNGLVLAEDGKKMSKKLKNYPSPMEVINDYGADALRIYLINSPVVRAETLRFKKDGVYGVVKDVFLPWYNAYRFLVQNAKRLEVEGLAPFSPFDIGTLKNSSNVLDQWINSATQSLVHFVRQEMDAYRLYTVVPYLLKFLDNLTNIYVRFNRKRLKGRTGEEDCRTALSTLYSRDERIERSVSRMMTVIDLARNIRERHNKPLKSPLREMIVVHPDSDFLDDIAGKLKEDANLNRFCHEVYSSWPLIIVCAGGTQCKISCPMYDTLKYSSLRAEPEFSVLGKRLGKSMGIVAKEIKAMSQKDILAFEEAGEATIASHTLKLADIKVVREFKRPAGLTEKEIDAAGDGDVLVIMDLRPDESLYEAGVAREDLWFLLNGLAEPGSWQVVNRIQKLRKKVALEPTDVVDVYFESLDEDKSKLERVLNSQEQYIRDAIGSPLLSSTLMPPQGVVIGEESYHQIYELSFTIYLARAALVFKSDAILALYAGNTKFARGLETYLLSRDHSNLRSEFQLRNGKITIDCIENQPAVNVVLGEHLFLTVGDYFLRTREHSESSDPSVWSPRLQIPSKLISTPLWMLAQKGAPQHLFGGFSLLRRLDSGSSFAGPCYS
ncbi:hypothetical protein GH714_010457 [Hevea brasiliensis]|uniref:isoleucine--tRNA ligase n=1 Tax=Hevea brasiliensis TaxID=3981 RepID=A0A6A6LGP7_HEVBR|nr:hypothetical protein GH714_010457 [Hevea brasiliensis]